MRPEEVTSPKEHWKLDRVIYDGGNGGWSAAEGKWKGREDPQYPFSPVWENVLAIRWNGTSDKDLGEPRTTDIPIWFIVPCDLEPVIRDEIRVRKIEQRLATLIESG